LLVRRARMLPPARFGRWIGQSMLAGIGLFLMPALLAHLAASSISDFTRAGLMMLTPIFTVVLEPYLGDGQAHQGRGALLAAIAGAVGAFCIFPVFIPFTVSASAAFFAIILAAACAAASTCYAVRLVAVLPSKSIAPFAAVATATAAVGYAAVGLAVEPFVWHGLPAALLLSALVEAPALYLLFWLMRRLSASRITTRYLLAPAIAILTGAVMLRSPLVLRNWLGLGLIVPGAAYLLLSGEERSEETGLSLK
jgi:drug/metabolite transporter (DMT)-like permease